MSVSINLNSPLPFINANLTYFQQQIQQGVNDGSLAPSEDQTLTQEFSQIQQTEQQDLAGAGGISQSETEQLWNDLAEMNNDIYSLRTNSLGNDAAQTAYANGEPQLITAQNFWENPAVAQQPDYAPPEIDVPQYGSESSNPLGFDDSLLGLDQSGNPAFSDADSFDQELSQMESFQSQQLNSSQSVIGMFSPSALGTALTMAPGFLTFLI